MGGCLTPIGDPPLLMGFMRGVLPGMSAFQDAAGNVRGIHLYGEVTLTLPALIEIVIILLAAFLSFKTTDSSIRTKNHFTWGAIKEVCSFVYWNFYYYAAGTDAVKICWTKPWN